MENLIWKPVVGYEGLYEVSNTGLIKSLITNRILSQSTNRGYLSVTLSKNGTRKNHKIHRIVAKAFIDNPNNYPYINHKDENKANNCVNNLEWCTESYNSNYSLNLHPERKKVMHSYLTDKETGALLSPRSQKGVPHKYTNKVAIVNDEWEIIKIYDNASVAAKEYKVRVTNLLATCRKNRERKFKYKTDGKIFVFLEN